jgi:hypothetical protein
MRFSDGIRIPILVTALCLPATGAGQQRGEGDQSIQPAAPVSSASPTQVREETPAPPSPADARYFLGAEEFTPGHVGRMRSYFLPSFQFLEMADSNFRVGPGPQKFETMNTLVGRLAFGKVGRHSRLTGDYMGGGQIYNRYSELNTTMHEFGITQSYEGRRWSLLLDDRATYLPEASFGYGGFGWTGALGPSLGGAPGSNIPNLNPSFSPTGALFTGRGARIMNTIAAQVQYLAGSRSAITLAGSYGLLHFRESGFIDSRNAFFLLGYSRSLTPRDYLGLDYGFGLFQFKSSVPTFQTHLLQLNYGHRITGRMAVSVGAGTQVNVFKTPLAGSNTLLSWSAHSSLDWRIRRGGVALFYTRYTTNGGGVLTGATTDNVQVAWTMGLTRNWSGSLSPGYSHNRSLPQTTSGNTGITYDSAYAGASLSRRLGPYMTMFFTYNLQTQRSENVPCLTGDCAASLLRHLVGFGFSWHPREIMID